MITAAQQKYENAPTLPLSPHNDGSVQYVDKTGNTHNLKMSSQTFWALHEKLEIQYLKHGLPAEEYYARYQKLEALNPIVRLGVKNVENSSVKPKTRGFILNFIKSFFQSFFQPIPSRF